MRISVKLWFYMPRPKSDFVNGEPSRGLKASTVDPFVVIKPDTDNLVKFALDAMKGVVFHDDRQVVTLIAYKLRDDAFHLDGMTCVSVSEFDSRTDFSAPDF